MRYRFIDRNEASDILSQEDDYTRNMSNTTIQMLGIRTPNQYLQNFNRVAQDWTPQEEERFTNYFNQVNDRLEELGINSDTEILFAKTNGRESMGMPYTRHNVVVLTEPYIGAELSGMQIPNVSMGMGMIAHEIFHILSRNNENLREEMYTLCGFEHAPLRGVPNGILTNPDAPNNDYAITVNHNGRDKRVTPVLMVRGMGMNAMMNADKYLVGQGEVIHRDETNYLELVGMRGEMSAYHPEEISAEYFRYCIEDLDFENKDAFLEIIRRAN